MVRVIELPIRRKGTQIISIAAHSNHITTVVLAVGYLDDDDSKEKGLSYSKLTGYFLNFFCTGLKYFPE